MSLFDLLAKILSGAYSLTNNYGLAIMLFTLAVMVLVTPLTLKGTKSMLAMQKLQPEIKKIQTKYKDDVQKRNEEMMRFYKENNINPVGGCLPLLIQMPIFFVLYRVLIGLTQRAPYGQDMGHAFGRALGERGAVFEQFGRFRPAYLRTGALFDALRSSRTMNSFGVNLANSTSQALGDGVGKALPFVVLIAVVAATGWYQQRQLQARTPASAQNPQQQMLMKIMPFFLPVISFGLPAGVVLYFVVSNLYRIGQQAFITRTMYADVGGGGVALSKPSPTSAKKGSLPPKKSLRQQISDLKEQADLPQIGKAGKAARNAGRTPSKAGAATPDTKAVARQSRSESATVKGSGRSTATAARPSSPSRAPVAGAAPARKPPSGASNRSKKKRK